MPQEVVKLDVYFANKEDRGLANEFWLALWPDVARRPARQAHQTMPPDGCYIQIVAMAVLGTD